MSDKSKHPSESATCVAMSPSWAGQSSGIRQSPYPTFSDTGRCYIHHISRRQAQDHTAWICYDISEVGTESIQAIILGDPVSSSCAGNAIVDGVFPQ